MTKQKGRKRSNDQNDRQKRDFKENAANEPVWIWGVHASQAATQNPRRQVTRFVATENAIRRLGLTGAETLQAREIDLLLQPGAVHQGVAVCTVPLPSVGLAEIVARKIKRIAVLDQVTDPHNLGAVMRSAAAFDVGALIVQTRHTPPVTGIVAKAAAGAVEAVIECRVVNIARSLVELAEAGYTVIGLAGEAEAELADLLAGEDKLTLVFGAEGAGLRPAVAKACTWLARIPISSGMESLNISNAAAIAFYEASRTVRTVK